LDDDAQIEKALRTLSEGLAEIKQAYAGGGDSIIEGTATPLIRDGRNVQFIHESVRDFLLHRDGLRLIYPGLGQSVVGKSHDQLAKACISYLSTKELQINRFPSIDDNDGHSAASNVVNSYVGYVFWDYAVLSLFAHAKPGGISVTV